MADDEQATEAAKGEEEPKKKSKKAILFGLLLALALGGGGFYATFSGMILGTGEEHADNGHGGDSAEAEPLPAIAFVAIDPIIIAMRSEGRAAHLRFRAQLEVEAGTEDDVTMLMPRILDVLNTYLRAVDILEIERPSALLSLRAQMLRRIQIVTGEGRVKDLLVTEFVVN